MENNKEWKYIKALIKADKKFYQTNDKKYNLFCYITKNQRLQYLKNLILARKLWFYRNQKGVISALKRTYYERKYNKLSLKDNINIRGEVGKNLKISHENIIINRWAQIGDNVVLHGNNCIGNLNNGTKDCPKIGNGCDIGFGSIICGGITLADNIVVGANSFVNKSFLESNVVIAGNPAKIIGERKK